MRILLSLKDDLYASIKELAKEKGLNLSSLIRYILTEYVKRDKSGKKQ